MKRTLTTLALCVFLGTSLFAQTERSRRTTEGTTSGSSRSGESRNNGGESRPSSGTETRRNEPILDTPATPPARNNDSGTRTEGTRSRDNGNGGTRTRTNDNDGTRTEGNRNNNGNGNTNSDERSRGRGRNGEYPNNPPMPIPSPAPPTSPNYPGRPTNPPPSTQNPPRDQNTGGWNRDEGRWGDSDNNRYDNDRNRNRDRDRDRNRDRDRYRNNTRYDDYNYYNNNYYYGYDNWYSNWWYDQHRSSWSHNFVFNQYISVDGGWYSNRRNSELQIKTTLRQRTNRYSSNADVEFDIDRIQLYQDGRFLGEIRNLPYNFSRVKARVDRYGEPRFENMIYLMGSPEEGFELMNSDFNDNYLSSWFRNRQTQVATVDFRSRRVRTTYRSRFLNDRNNDYVSIPLVPETNEYGLGYATSDWNYYDNGGYDNDYYRSNGRSNDRSNAYDSVYGRASSTGEAANRNNSNATPERAPELPRVFKQEQTQEMPSGTQNLRVNRRVEIERDNQR